VAWVVALMAVCTGRSRNGDGGVAFMSERGLRLLAGRLWETCDRGYVERWSAGTMESMIGMITDDDDGLVEK